MEDRKEFGTSGEDRAAAYLLEKGYSLVTRRFRARNGEIDIVCLDGDTIVFVEVKSRRAPGYAPEDALGEAKLQAFRRAGATYLRKLNESREARFDVIAIDRKGLRHHLDIFGHRL